jgi:hypothetical protein
VLARLVCRTPTQATSALPSSAKKSVKTHDQPAVVIWTKRTDRSAWLRSELPSLVFSPGLPCGVPVGGVVGKQLWPEAPDLGERASWSGETG